MAEHTVRREATQASTDAAAIDPADYQGDESVIELRIGEQRLDCAFPFAQDGLGCVIPEGTFIGEQAISARLILNRGTPFEFVSQPIESPTQGRLIAGFAMGEELTAVDLAGQFPRNLSVPRCGPAEPAGLRAGLAIPAAAQPARPRPADCAQP